MARCVSSWTGATAVATTRIMAAEDRWAIELAAELLHQGQLVAFPTETVYGLGADARSDRAIARIYEAKGRPGSNPIIVHVADLDAAQDCVREFPQRAAPGGEVLARTVDADSPARCDDLCPRVRRAGHGGDAVSPARRGPGTARDFRRPHRRAQRESLRLHFADDRPARVGGTQWTRAADPRRRRRGSLRNWGREHRPRCASRASRDPAPRRGDAGNDRGRRRPRSGVSRLPRGAYGRHESRDVSAALCAADHRVSCRAHRLAVRSRVGQRATRRWAAQGGLDHLRPGPDAGNAA